MQCKKVKDEIDEIMKLHESRHVPLEGEVYCFTWIREGHIGLGLNDCSNSQGGVEVIMTRTTNRYYKPVPIKPQRYLTLGPLYNLRPALTLTCPNPNPNPNHALTLTCYNVTLRSPSFHRTLPPASMTSSAGVSPPSTVLNHHTSL